MPQLLSGGDPMSAKLGCVASCACQYGIATAWSAPLSDSKALGAPLSLIALAHERPQAARWAPAWSTGAHRCFNCSIGSCVRPRHRRHAGVDLLMRLPAAGHPPPFWHCAYACPNVLCPSLCLQRHIAGS